MWNKIITYLKSIISSTSDESHKRFLAILSWVLFVGMVIISWFGVMTPEVLVLSNLAIILGQSSLTMLEKLTKK